MKLWTIQNAEACKKALKTGSLRAPEDRDLMFISDEQFVPAYDWMADQMKKAIGMPPEGIQYPVWCWYSQEDINALICGKTEGMAEKVYSLSC